MNKLFAILTLFTISLFSAQTAEILSNQLNIRGYYIPLKIVLQKPHICNPIMLSNNFEINFKDSNIIIEFDEGSEFPDERKHIKYAFDLLKVDSIGKGGTQVYEISKYDNVSELIILSESIRFYLPEKDKAKEEITDYKGNKKTELLDFVDLQILPTENYSTEPFEERKIVKNFQQLITDLKKYAISQSK